MNRSVVRLPTECGNVRDWERFPHVWSGFGGPRLEEGVGNKKVQNCFGDGRGGVADVESANREGMEYLPYVRKADITGL